MTRRLAKKAAVPSSRKASQPFGGTPTLQTRLRALLEKCDRALENRGLAASRQTSRKKKKPTTKRQLLSDGYANTGEAAASPEWHAQVIREVCHELLVLLERGELDERAIELGIELGRKLSEWEWQHAYGRAIGAGRSVRGGAKRGGRIGGRRKANDTDDKIAKMRKLVDRELSVSSAAKHLAKGDRKKAGALRALWYYKRRPRKL